MTVKTPCSARFVQLTEATVVIKKSGGLPMDGSAHDDQGALLLPENCLMAKSRLVVPKNCCFLKLRLLSPPAK